MPARADKRSPIREWPEAIRRAVMRCADGDLAPNVALMQILIHAEDPAQARSILAQARRQLAAAQPHAAERLRGAQNLLDAGIGVAVKRIAAEANHASPPEGVAALAYWASVFDRAARMSPEAGVALYSLGDPALFEAATNEVVELMRGWGLLGPRRRVLDIGCGIGRFMARLVPEVDSVVGIEISAAMARTARERCARLGATLVIRCRGDDLAFLRDAAFDLAIAIDTFPYVTRSGAGLACRLFAETARVLASAGDFFLINYSYGCEDDIAMVDRLAEENDFVRLRTERPFHLWDGLVFHLRRIDGDA